MVTGAPVPAFKAGVRTKLYHAEWCTDAGEGMSVAAGTDEWIYKARILRLNCKEACS